MKFVLENRKQIISIEDASGFVRSKLSNNLIDSKNYNPTATSMTLPFHKCGEKFISHFTKHAIEKLQDYRIDLTTINVPIKMLSEELLDLKYGDKFAIFDKDLGITLVGELEAGYEYSIYINIITIFDNDSYSPKKNDYALSKIDNIFILGE